MSIDRIIDAIADYDGILVLAPQPGSEHPEIAWGDSFFYYAPDGAVPTHTQPFATVVTKDYPDDVASRLDEYGRRRLNIHADRQEFIRLTGEDPHKLQRARDFAAVDQVLPHPVYASMGWVAIVEPAEATTGIALALVHSAYESARARHEKRRDTRVASAGHESKPMPTASRAFSSRLRSPSL